MTDWRMPHYVRLDMNTLSEKLHELVSRYQRRGLDNGDGLLPPADIESITEAERQLGFALPAPLREIYAVFGGQEHIAAGITGIFGSHRLHTPDEIGSMYKMYQEVEEEERLDGETPPPDSLPGEYSRSWHPALIPFATWDAYNLVMCRHTEFVYEFEPYSGLSERKYETIDHLLDVILEEAATSAEPSLDFITPE